MTIIRPASRKISNPGTGMMTPEWEQKLLALFGSVAAITAAGTAMITAADAAAQEALLAGYLPPFAPQGRLTLTSGAPVLTSTVSGATTVYYTPYVGQMCPIWSGARFYPANLGGELSQAATDATKSPAAVAASSLYDMFVWSDGGTFRCTRGPAWSSATARGTGAGTTELNTVNGVLVNKNAITNGPAAGFGTYVGTIASNGSSTIDFILGGASNGGTAAFLNVWNAYNRTKTVTYVQDTTTSWTYGTASYRSANNSTGNRVTFVSGLQRDFFAARYTTQGAAGAGLNFSIAIGLDNVTTPSGPSPGCASTATVVFSTDYVGSALGQHYVQALETASGASVTFFGHGNLFFDFMA